MNTRRNGLSDSSENLTSRGRSMWFGLQPWACLLCLALVSACAPRPPGAKNWLFSMGPQTYAAALGDLDGDGDLDAFVGNERQEDEVWLNAGGAQGGGPGTFIPGGTIGGAEPTRSVALADLDGDGDLDALVVYGDSAGVWLNDGLAGFTAGESLTFEPQHALALGDLDGDGHVDIFAGSVYHEILVWFNDGKGSFR